MGICCLKSAAHEVSAALVRVAKLSVKPYCYVIGVEKMVHTFSILIEC